MLLRHAGHGEHRLRRHALDHERHAGPAADADVDGVGGQPLLHPGVAAEGRDIELEPVLGEDADLHADVDRGEGPGERHRLADAQLFRRTRGRGENCGKRRYADQECEPVCPHGHCSPLAV